MAGRLRPLERLGALGIVSLDEPFQFGLQFRNAGEYATVQCTPLQLSKPAFHGIELQGPGPNCFHENRIWKNIRALLAVRLPRR